LAPSSVSRLCSRNGTTPVRPAAASSESGRAVLVVPDLRGLLAAAGSGAGATVLPRYLGADELAEGRLVSVLDADDPPINTLYLVTRAAAVAEPHIAHASRALMSEARHW